MVENRWAYIKPRSFASHLERRRNKICFDTCSKGKKKSSSKLWEAKEKVFLNFNGVEKEITYGKGRGLCDGRDKHALWGTLGKAKQFLSGRASKRSDCVFEKTFVTRTSSKYFPKQTSVFPGLSLSPKSLNRMTRKPWKSYLWADLGFVQKTER